MTKSPNPVDVHVGGRVRLRRMHLGMSQEKLGDQLGLTFQQVQKYEKGANRIGASRLYKIAQLLGVPVQYFFDDMPENAYDYEVGGLDQENATQILTHFLSTAEGLQLNMAFSRIRSDETRKRIIDLIKTLADNESSASEAAE